MGTGVEIGEKVASSTAAAETTANQGYDALSAVLVQAAATLKAATLQANTALHAAELTARIALIVAALSLVGVLIAAVVAWRNTHIQSVTAEQMKLADFRQAWINKLREELARFAKLAISSDEDGRINGDLAESMYMILFLMNWRDPDYDELKQEMMTISAASAKKDDLTEALAHFALIGQDILNREWWVTKTDLHDRPPAWPFDGKDRVRRAVAREVRQDENAARRADYRASLEAERARIASAAIAAQVSRRKLKVADRGKG